MKVALQLGADAILVAHAFLWAMVFRLEGTAFAQNPEVWIAMLVATVATLGSFWFLGLYQAMVRFINGNLLVVIAVGAVIGCLSLYLAGLSVDAKLPRSVPILFAICLFLSVGGLRFLAQTYFRDSRRPNKQPVIIFGAGEAGPQISRSLLHGREYAPVAFVDDDTDLHDLIVAGLKVFPATQIRSLIKTTGTQVVLLAVPSMSRARRREILGLLEDLKLDIKTIPGLSEIISGKATVSDLRTVSPEDLLGRDPVDPDPELLGRTVTGRVVMVSGAGGSIGSELCRQILQMSPAVLVLFEISEYSLYSIEAEVSAISARSDLPTAIIPVLGSVQNDRLLEATIRAFGVQTIFHAAAYKHVPLIEENVVEGIRNNIFGTLAISSVSRRLGVTDFIMVSTDKAVRPTNVMGATKRVAELICQAHAQETSTTCYSSVRFGNVLGSSGSVIPRFRQQIEAGGPVTVTHRDITRYFMTIPEAAQLVVQAGALAKGGDVFVLDMGEPVKILDLAVSMVKLHGLTPYIVDHPDDVAAESDDFPICITGLRKGEKLYEELLTGNNPSPTQHPRIWTASEAALPMAELQHTLGRLRHACDTGDLPKIHDILRELPIAYAPLYPGVHDLIWTAEQARFDPQTKERQKRLSA